jgi:hypothetical protein
MRVELTKPDALRFFSEFFCGEHHIPSGGVKEYGGPGSYCVNFYGDLSTFDFDRLTALVFLAHDRCVRVAVMSSGPRMVKIVIWNRDGREGEIWSKHPTLETAVERWRKHTSEKPLCNQATEVSCG